VPRLITAQAVLSLSHLISDYHKKSLPDISWGGFLSVYSAPRLEADIGVAITLFRIQEE
jgi:hypothetical protein